MTNTPPPQPEATLPIREGMIVISKAASIKTAKNDTKRQRKPPTLLGELRIPETSTRGSYQESTIAASPSRYKLWRPCVVIFTDKPTAESVIVAPITGRGGYLADDESKGITDENERHWHFPIPNTPTHSVTGLIPGQGEVDQEVADIPKWSERTDKDGAVKSGPQYLVLGMPVACPFKYLRINEEDQKFCLDERWTKWCQEKCLSFMTAKEIEEYALELQALEHLGNRRGKLS